MKALTPLEGLAVTPLAGGLAALAQVSGPVPGEGQADSVVADNHGNLHVPRDYRSRCRSLGSGRSPPTMGLGRRRRILYASPETIDAYRKTGRFPRRGPGQGGVRGRDEWHD